VRILVTGGEGFIAKNLRVRLRELGQHDIRIITRHSTAEQLSQETASADFVFHLAGVNRADDARAFEAGNHDLTARLCAGLLASGRKVPVAYSSSTHATRDTPYGRSKLAAERVLQEYAATSGAPVWLFRLTNVFGKWSRPHYNSAVATFCHNVARGLEISVADAATPLKLLYVDDVISAFTDLLVSPPAPGFVEAQPVYAITLGEMARLIQSFAAIRQSLVVPGVGAGLTRALYATYVSFLPTDGFAYAVPQYADPRGVFVEMLKTPDCGQFSYFTANPGITRGEHYHHTKTEKFLVIRGSARFGFRHLETGELFEVTTHGGEARIVESIPGWAHNVVNVGEGELIVMLWANEIFDRARPDTVSAKVAS
jgi:UDP-2-acetamido-2,6-beta-L-arabino-hexul-4-ose reductase